MIISSPFSCMYLETALEFFTSVCEIKQLSPFRFCRSHWNHVVRQRLGISIELDSCLPSGFDCSSQLLIHGLENPKKRNVLHIDRLMSFDRSLSQKLSTFINVLCGLLVEVEHDLSVLVSVVFCRHCSTSLSFMDTKKIRLIISDQSGTCEGISNPILFLLYLRRNRTDNHGDDPQASDDSFSCRLDREDCEDWIRLQL